jgi:uncharacterized membrane protein YfbV (UPF0208 family)
MAVFLMVGAESAPDLFVSEFSLDPATPVQGSPVTVRLGVYNMGTAPSGPFTVQWWPGENYQDLGCSWPVDGLVAHGGRILTCTYDGYPSWYSNINTKVVVDSDGAVAESDEANNVFLKPISVSRPGAGSPDLFVSEFSLDPATPVQGSPVTVRLGVYNKGTAPSGPFSVEWWPGENYQDLGCSWPVDGLVARGGRILTCTYDGYPSWYSNINTKVVVDSGGAVAESDEANNIFLKPISVTQPGAGSPGPVGPAAGSPDLFVSEFSLDPATPVQDSPVTVRLGVYNKGTAPSGPFSIEWWPGENYQDLGCGWEVEGLVAGGGRILTCTYPGYPSWYSNINTKVVVDSGGAVAESDEANNIFLKPISVTQPGAGSPGLALGSPDLFYNEFSLDQEKHSFNMSQPESAVETNMWPTLGSPDLFVSEFSLDPATPVQGSPVTVRLGVYNKGTAPSGPFTVEWWPGENYQDLGCSWPVDGLVAHGGRILTCTYDGYPSWYSNINTKVVVDSDGAVAEGDEANNVFLKAISVSKPGFSHLFGRAIIGI